MRHHHFTEEIVAKFTTWIAWGFGVNRYGTRGLLKPVQTPLQIHCHL